MKRNERGAIVVEATISLSVFMFAIVTILSVVNICFAQAKIGVAVNQTAKEISQYSYLYSLTGLNQKQADLYSGSEGARENINNTLDGVVTLFDSAKSLGGTASGLISNPSEYSKAYEDINTSIQSGKGGFETIKNEIESVASDPQEFIIGCAKLLGSNAIDEVKSRAVAAPLSKLLVKKHLNTESGEDCEKFLKRVGIVPSNGSYLNGLDFNDSVIFLNGSDEIKVIVHYDVQVIKLLGIDIKFSFTQCGATKGWSAAVPQFGTDSGDSDDGGDTKETSETESDSEDEDKPLSYEEYAKLGTHNDSSDMVVLGKFNPTDSDESYIETAKKFKATYFDLEIYNEVAEKIGEQNMWNINKEFLGQQKAAGKNFYLTEDPNKATGVYANEVAWLKTQGYSFEYNAGVSMWKAVKD